MSLPFDSWLKMATFELGLLPEQAWKLTFVDLRALMRSREAGPMTFERLTELSTAYPDGDPHV